MHNTFTSKTSLAVAVLLALPLAEAAAITEADYKAGKASISAQYKADKAACASFERQRQGHLFRRPRPRRRSRAPSWSMATPPSPPIQQQRAGGPGRGELCRGQGKV